MKDKYHKRRRRQMGKHENETESNNDGNLSTRLSVNNITQLADKSGWAKPDRRPRQYSVGSTGSWQRKRKRKTLQLNAF